MWSAETLEWIDIELTSFCNIQCKGCHRLMTDHADKMLDKEYITIETIRNRFQKEMFPNIRVINFCGSVDEPTTHPQFFDIIEHFADWGVHINVATNGSLRTTKWWTQLANILPSSHRVTWGIDGSDELSEVYREGSNFKKVQQNFRAFNKAGGLSVWQFIEFEHNQHQTELAKQIAKDEGFVDFRTIMSHRKDTNEVKYKKVVQEETPYISCKYGKQKRIFVNHMGNVIPCCHLNAKMLEYSFGLKKRDLFEELLEDSNYKNDINLSSVSIEQAINGKVFNGIIDSWENKNKILKCWNTCKKMKRDIFLQEKL